jgi:hypothetical protein
MGGNHRTRQGVPRRLCSRISTGDFSEALAALLGNDAAGLCSTRIGRLDLLAKRYVRLGGRVQARLEEAME